MTARRSLRQLHPKRRVLPVLLVVAIALLAAGLYLPLLTIEKMVFWENRYSVATGVFGLAADGQYVLAAVVLFWSVLFPIAKLVLLVWIWFVPMHAPRRSSVLRALERLGKWSMLDVFIVAVLIVAAKLGPVAEVTAEPGLYVFGAAVVLSMLVADRMGRLARAGEPRERS